MENLKNLIQIYLLFGEEKNKKLLAKGILKACVRPLIPYLRNGETHVQTCRNPSLEFFAEEIVNSQWFKVDVFLIIYFFLIN